MTCRSGSSNPIESVHPTGSIRSYPSSPLRGMRPTSLTVDGLNSDRVLRHLRSGLEATGFEVERSKKTDDNVRRPVLSGELGSARVAYKVDAFYDELGIVCASPATETLGTSSMPSIPADGSGCRSRACSFGY